ncbi:MAG: SpoIIE family protein phosphatase [Bacteroidales bacterium]
MIRILTNILVLTLLCNQVFAQQSAAEMEKMLQTAQGKDKFNLLYKIAKSYLGNDNKKSIQYGKQAQDLATELNEKSKIADALNITGSAYFNDKNYKNALKCYEQELGIRSGLKQESSRVKTLFNIGSVYEAWEKYPKAMEYYKLAIESAKKIKSTQVAYKAYESLIRIYYIEKDFKKAFEELRSYMNYKSETKLAIEGKKISVLETQYEEEKKAHEKKIEELRQKDSTITQVKTEKEILVKDTIVKNKAIQEKEKTIKKSKEEIKRQQQWITAFIVFFVVIAVFSILLYKLYRDKKKANIKLAFQNAEIIEQKEEIIAQSEQLLASNKKLSEQHAEILEQKMQITDSIRYASRIQGVMLPQQDLLNEIFKEYMVLWRPQEIVSGDFYWVKQIKNFVIFAAADCTGHGVPGAFMSMLGISFLNEIISKSRFDKSNEILNILRKRVKKALNQTGKINEATDGMDIAMCILDTENNILQYSGAYNPLYLIRDNQLQIFKADKQPIAIYPREKDFTYNEIEVHTGDVLYIFSDGYIDQFGGEHNEKLKGYRFRQLLLDIHQKPMKEQKIALNTYIENWIGKNNSQTDDIMVFGIRI